MPFNPSYILLLIFLIGSGALVGYFDLSYWWGILPALIGGFWGSYVSRFGKLLMSPDITEAQREKLLATTRVLTIGWSILSVVFFVMGYSFVKGYLIH